MESNGYNAAMTPRTDATGNEENLYEHIFNSVLDAIFVVNMQGGLLEVNAAACRGLEYSRDELLALTLAEIDLPEFAELVPVRMELLRKRGEIVFESVHLTKSGRRIAVEVKASRIDFKGQPAVLSIVRDVSVRNRLQDELIRSRDHYLKLFEDFPALIWRADITGRCNYFNKTWLAFTGKTLEQELGDGWLDGVHPDDRERCMKRYLEAFGRRGPFEMEYRLACHDGSYHWIVDHGSPFYDLDGSFAGYIGSCYDINAQKQAESSLQQERALLEQRVRERSSELMQINSRLEQQIAERQLVEDALRESRDTLRELTSHLTLTKESERTSMARTVHDQLGTYLTALRFDLSWFKRHFPPADTAVAERFANMEANLRDATITVSQITSELRPVILDTLGIESAIEYLVDDFEKRTGITCELVIEACCRSFDATTAINLYRILQESLSNILRHSGATRVDVALKYNCDQIEFKIADNGWGVAEPALSSSHSYGLVGMRERARICGGHLSVYGTPGGGTTVLVLLPFKPGEAANA